jgi:hypothetical protein
MQTPTRRPAAAHTCLRLIAGCLLVGGLAACGYKGPLYLPAPEAPPAELTAPPTNAVPPEAAQSATPAAQ